MEDCKSMLTVVVVTTNTSVAVVVGSYVLRLPRLVHGNVGICGLKISAEKTFLQEGAKNY